MKMIVPFAKGALQALGSNEKAARLTGIQVDRVKIAIFSITGLLSGVAAFLYIARFGSVDVATAGSMFELDVIAAVANWRNRYVGRARLHSGYILSGR